MDRNKNNAKNPLKGKGAVAGMVLCFAAVLITAGSFTFRSMQKKKELQLVRQREQAARLERQAKEAAANKITIPAEKSAEDVAKNADIEPAAQSLSGNADKIWFDEGSTLHWPVSGGVLIPFSMDSTVYFPTLEQYRYNPAMIFAGDVGETICAAAPGIVVNVKETLRTGVTVTLNMGNGYVAVYGQLAGVNLNRGDFVEENERIGELAEPTKYYALDGPNLYFELRKDNIPQDPLNYMEP